MKNKRLLFLLVIVFIIIFLLGCVNGDNKPVKSISILTGSIKVNYAIDEEIDLSNAYILISYEDGTFENKLITRSMITGFDNRKTLPNGLLTVSHKGKEDKYFYSVGNNEPVVNTYARVLMEKQQSKLVFSLKGLEEYEQGIYAVTFLIEIANKSHLSDFTVLDAESGDRLTQESVQNGIKVLYYNVYATPFTTDKDFLRVNFSPSATDTVVRVKNIEISDGVSKIRLPDKSITL